MIHPAKVVIALVTAPDMDAARRIAQTALAAKAAACANLVPQVESHYWWEGKIEQSAEVLIIFKTTAPASVRLQQVVLANHPYQTPEFVTMSVETGSPAYLAWVRQSAP